MNGQSIKDKVKAILEKNPKCRDNDNELCALIWKQQMQENGYMLSHFLFAYASNLLLSSESICRFARMIKNDHPELKGTRKRKSEREVINDLKQLK